MRVDIDGVTLELMGDPHLGKRFVNGVPLHRRGERERMVRADFGASLAKASEVDLHVCLGDLFDKAVVPYEVILDAADAYDTIASKNPRTTFVILRGNHDQGRDEEAVTAFDLFARMVEGRSNILVVYGPAELLVKGVGFIFLPWSSQATLEEDVRFAAEDSLVNLPAVAFFHADVDPRNGEDNLIPTEALAELGITRAFTGHDHKPRRFERDGVDVTVVGSLQPFGFGEEVDDSLYVTTTKEELERLAGDEWISMLRNRAVRVDLAPGETRDIELDCLQLIYRSAEEKMDETPKVELGDFDLERLAGEVFAELGLDEATAAKVKGLISSQRMRT